MAESLIFLGAGASRPFGISTMQELVKEFEDELKKKGSKGLSLYSRIKSIQEKHYKTKNVDIESVYSVIDGLARGVKPADFDHVSLYYIASKGTSGEFPEQDKEIAKILKEELENFIKEKCKPTISEDEIIKLYENTYEPLFSNLSTSEKHSFSPNHTFNNRWKTYTTNYDKIFEGFWGDFLTLNDFFTKEGNSTHYVFDSSKPVQDQCYIKLHGSIGWLKRKGDGEIMKKGETITRHVTEGEVLIFPIQQKNLYLHPWYEQFLHFKMALQETHEWIVIGYSFNDEFILNVFKEAMTTGRRFIIINPHAEKLKKLFPKEYHDSIIALPIKFGGKLFKEQFSDFKKGSRELDIEIEARSHEVDVVLEKPNDFADHEIGEFDTGDTVEEGTTIEWQLRARDSKTRTATAKVYHLFKHPLEQLDFTIFSDTPNHVFLRVKYNGERLNTVITSPTKDIPHRGYQTVFSIMPQDILVK